MFTLSTCTTGQRILSPVREYNELMAKYVFTGVLMRKNNFYVLNRKIFYFLLSGILLLAVISLFLFLNRPDFSTNIFEDPKNGLIVIDPGHGGIDGGTNKDGLLEKDINLSVAKKLKAILEARGYRVLMTREEDVSLEDLINSRQSRHMRDLKARLSIINTSNAQMFVSVHVNSNPKRPAADGAIVFYSGNYEESKTLAYSVQRALNTMVVQGKKRTTHDPVPGAYYILEHAQIPGVLIETAFISNAAERELLTRDEFREYIASSIADGIGRYMDEPGKVFSME